MRVALPRSGLRIALPRSGVLKTVHFRRFDPLRSKIFFGPRATRDGQRATRERYAQALRASATRKLRLRQSLDNYSRLFSKYKYKYFLIHATGQTPALPRVCALCASMMERVDGEGESMHGPLTCSASQYEQCMSSMRQHATRSSSRARAADPQRARATCGVHATCASQGDARPGVASDVAPT